MTFIDTHTHLYGEEFDADRAEMVERAREAGAEKLLLPNVDEESIGRMLQMCDDFPDLCLPMMGLQPEELPADPWPLVEKMKHLLYTTPERYCAVGEVGIDLYWDQSRREEQIEVFREEIRWANELRKPLVIHARNAHQEIVTTLREADASQIPGGIFHCFGGTTEEARELLTFDGFYLGIGGIVTFKKSTLPAVLHTCVPLNRILLETDAPYLTPVPHRGKRNESAYIPHIIDKLAEIYDTTTEEVARITTENARNLFAI
ncbi:TatD family hydrolase [Alloprevotella rava]|uniref:TatD DNase family protein n=1 Tax=Alloprevotella rava TaxID=671218 RepID=A0A7W5XXP4_9BACT|nr:TatD family hydrolase [Alloprevotella rava]MBB3702410.1 TatD DNase family protein [Alloprevotella rava]